MKHAADTPLDSLAIEHYVEDLRNLLQSASFLQCKAFLGAFIRRIEFNRQQVGIEYTAPIPARNGLTATAEVLNVRRIGSPGRIQTGYNSFDKRPIKLVK